MEILVTALGGVLPPTGNMENRLYTPEEKRHKVQPETFEDILKKAMSK